MKNFKKIVALTTACLAVLSITGCASEVDTSFKPFEGDPTQLKAKVTFWHTMGKTNQETLNRMIANFNKIYPNIKIEHAQQGGYPDIKKKVSNAIPAGTTPTMAFCYPDHVAEYLSAGAIENMTPYIDDPIIGLSKEAHDSKGGSEDFIEGFWNEGNAYGTEFGVEGGMYSVPYSKSTEVMFYNNTFFKENGYEVPKTWDEMESLMKKIADLPVNKDKDPENDVIALGYDSDANMLITMMEQYGIPYTSADPENHYLFNNPEAKALVTKLKGWYDNKYLITAGAIGGNAYTSNYFTGDKKPQVAMTIGSTGGTKYNYTPNFEIGVASVPGVLKEDGTIKDSIISQGPSVCFFSRSKLQDKYAAWLFYKFITNTDNSATYSVLTGYSPVRSSSFESPIFKKYINDINKEGEAWLIQQALKFNKKLQSKYFVSPAFKGSSTAREEMDGIIANVFLGTKSVDKAFTDALTNCVFAG